jgi:hypothetical protein
MAKICYTKKRFTTKQLDLIDKTDKIIEHYHDMGYQLTLRQIYYQFVAKDLFHEDMTWRLLGNNKWVRDPNGTKNAEPNYKYLGNLISDARLAGLLDWNAIIDRTRSLKANPHWTGAKDIVTQCANQFQIDKWADQRMRFEVWIEKDALVGVIEDVCAELDVPHFSCRGYTSQSEMWAAAQRHIKYLHEENKGVIIVHLGDHDPSGKDMSRDIEDRMGLFIGTHLDNWEKRFHVVRVALNMNQVDEYQPPPNPAKITDPRAKSYLRDFGDESWELDALEPQVISDLIRKNVLAGRDEKLWAAQVKRENAFIKTLKQAAKDMK